MRRCGCPTGDGPGDPVAGVSSAEVDVFSPDKKWGGLEHFVRSRLQKSEPDSLEKESGSHPAIRNAANATGSGYGYGNDTSQKLDSADEKARIASFVAVAPIDDPQFLCLVCLDEPHSWTTAGGSLSAPVCAEVLEQTLVYKGVPRAADTGSADAQAAALPADGDSFDGA